LRVGERSRERLHLGALDPVVDDPHDAFVVGGVVPLGVEQACDAAARQRAAVAPGAFVGEQRRDGAAAAAAAAGSIRLRARRCSRRRRRLLRRGIHGEQDSKNQNDSNAGLHSELPGSNTPRIPGLLHPRRGDSEECGTSRETDILSRAGWKTVEMLILEF
jgi:hypothetical protein